MTAIEQAISEAPYAVRDCPTCGSMASTADVRAESPAEERAFEQLRQHWYGFFKEKMFFSYDRCTNCGILFAPRFFTSTQLEYLYASMPANMEEVSNDALERTQRGYFEELRRNAELGGDFLEIGPDVGLFARHCAREGRFSKFWMFEPNVDAHDRLRRNLGDVDVSISTALLDLSAVGTGSLGVAAMIHVLDHILDPVEFLRELRPKLRSDGKLFVVTHDEKSLMARATKGRWPAYCLQHPHLFNPASMATLLGKAGFRLERTIRSVNYFPVTFLAEQAALVAGVQFHLPRLPKIQLPLRLGNFITVAAVK